MDAMDILGGLLKKKAGSSGLGGQILKDILGGGRPGTTASSSQSRPAPQRPPGSPVILDAPEPSGHRRMDATARQRPGDPLDNLEEMLRHAHNRTSQPPDVRRSPAPQPQHTPNYPQPNYPQPSPGYPQRAPGYQQAEYDGGMNERTELIVRAMINASKADGRIDQTEQDAILKQLGNPTQEDIEFLRREFAAPLDLKEFVWSVPLGMEQEIYAISIMAINLDTRAEHRYLQELAHGLRMPPTLCAQIHQRFGVPPLQ